jgi:hypothetical protein
MTDVVNERLAAEEAAELLKASHAGTLETSIMLHLHPELVRPRYRDLPRLKRSAMLGWRGRTPTRWQGYVGSPALAEAEWGALATDRLGELGARLVIRLVDEGRSAAKAGRLLPRVPFWLARRRATMLAGALLTGVGATLLVTRLFAQGETSHERTNP